MDFNRLGGTPMKFSVITDVLGTDSFDEALSIAKQLDFEYVDIRAKLNGSMIDIVSVEQAAELKKKVDEHGLKVSALTSWAVNPCSMTEPPSYDNYDERFHDEMSETLERLCKLANIFESTYIRIYSLSRPEGFDQLSDEDKAVHYEHNATIMRRHAETAGKYNKIILVENEPPTLTSCAMELGIMIKLVNHPNLKVNWDIVNEWIGGRYATVEDYEHIKGSVDQIHLKGGFGQPNSEDELNPYGKFLKVGIPGKDDFHHAVIMKEIINHDPQVMMTFDPHYTALDATDQIGEVEVVRQSKRFIGSIFKASAR